MTKSVKALSVLFVLTALAGCNTVAGAGNDLQNAGAAVTHEARKAQAN